jgi:serine protease Do
MRVDAMCCHESDMKEDIAMRAALTAILVLVALLAVPPPTYAQTVGQVFQKVSPSVAVIRAKGREVSGPGGVTRFNETGSGVLISPDGKVMTAAHVVHAMDEITVEFLGGETVTARVIGSEPAADLSLLQLDRVPPAARVAPLADSSSVKVGDQVVVVGAPYGLSYALSVGWISARWPPNTVYRQMPLAEFFQTDAVINTGNSGGPMFNMAGEVIGIVSHNISKSGGSEGLGFVVTANTAKELLLAKRSFWSGLEGELLTTDLADLFNLPRKSVGYIVKAVARGSTADGIGLRGGTKTATIDGQSIVVGGDIILAVDGVNVTSLKDLVAIRDGLNRKQSGDPFTVTVLRGGETLELTGRVR